MSAADGGASTKRSDWKRLPIVATSPRDRGILTAPLPDNTF